MSTRPCGQGFGLSELSIVLEELGFAMAPGPFLPTTLAAALLAERGTDSARTAWIPGLADGSLVAAVGLGGDLEISPDGRLAGSPGLVLGAGLAQLLLVCIGDDVALLQANQPGVTVEPQNGQELGVASVAAKYGLSLLKDRAHGFLVIIAPEPATCVPELVAQVGFEVVRETDPRDQALRLCCGKWRDFGDLLAVGNKGLIEAIGVDDCADQPERKRCVGIEHLLLEKEAHRPLVIFFSGRFSRRIRTPLRVSSSRTGSLADVLVVDYSRTPAMASSVILPWS